MAKEFVKQSGLTCDLCEENNYDFSVLEFVEIPVVFVLDRSEGLHEFLTSKEAKDSNYIRAYTRRFLTNLRFAVVEVGDKAFAQFVDDSLIHFGAKNVQELVGSEEIKEFSANFAK